jgi:hypothetical protein
VAIYQYLWLYDDFDVPLDGAGNSTCSTNPAHVRPYLIHVMDTAESKVDFLEGQSTIGQVNIKVLDKRVTASDQTTGWFTAILASTAGENKLVGRRVTLDARDGAGVLQYVIFDGVINEVSLDTDLVTYTIITRDVRDNERAQPLFNLTGGATSVFPPGIRDGYGKYIRSGGATSFMVPAAPVMGGQYKTLAGITGGQIRLDHSAQSITPEMYHEQYEHLNMTSTRFDQNGVSLGYCFPNIIVRWRDEATHGAWNTLTNMPVLSSTYSNVFETDSQVFEIDVNADNLLKLKMSSYDLVRLFSDGTGAFPLPANNQRVEVQVLSNLPPSELYPFWWDGNLGQLLKDIYDGVYSYTNPKIRYNAAAMTAFIAAAPNGRIRLTEQVDDMRPWVEENIYKPLGYAPAINQNGEVVPVSMFLPDASVAPITLDNTNCKSAEWKHTSDDSVTKVTWKWKSDSITYPLYRGNWWKPPRPISQEVKEADREDIYLSASAAYVGMKEVTYEPVTFRDIAPLQAFDAAQTNSTARQAQKVGRQLIDRFRYGGQHIIVKGARRSDTGVAALKVGDWVICGFAHLPDYGTHIRGMSRLAQVISLNDTDPISRDMELVDSGPSGAPLSIPTINSVTPTGQFIVVNVTAVAGADAAIEYAISASQPASGSPLWQRAARGGTGNYSLPILPVGVDVWVRARSEGIGKRPSAWAAAVNVSLGVVAYPYNASIVIENGVAVAKWESNEYMHGARVYYAITSYGLTPPTTLSTSFDVGPDLNTKDIGAVQAGDTISVEVEGWTGFTAGAVSGTQGRRTIAPQVTYAIQTEPISRPTIQAISIDSSGHVIVTVEGDDRTKSMKCAAVTGGTNPTNTQIRAGTNANGRTAVFNFGPFAKGDTIRVGVFAYSAINSTGTESLVPAYAQISYDLPAGIIVDYTPFASGIRPPIIVAALPGTATEGDTAVLTTDGKLYRYHSGAWTAAVGTGDLTGTISSAQIANGAVTDVKLASAAVTAAKVAVDAIDVTKILDAATGRSGNFFNETWDKLTPWDFSSGTSTPTLISGGSSGSKVLRSAGYVWGVWGGNPIPFNPLRIYRLRARYRATTDASVPANALIYIGLVSTDKDGIATNTNGGYDYVITSAGGATVAGGWVERETWVKGATKSTATGSQTPSTDPRAPSPLGIGTAFVKPMCGFNYNTGNGVFELDYIVIEEMSDVPGGQITALTVTAAELAAGSVVAGKIAAGTIVAADIAAATITGAKIAAGTIAAGNIAAGAVTAEKLTIGSMADSAILNGGFEEVSSANAALPARWRADVVFGGGPVALSTADFVSGGQCLDLNPGSGVACDAFADTIPLVPGETWYASCWAKGHGTGVTGFYFRLRGGATFNATNVEVTGGVENISVPTTWTKYEIAVVIPAGMNWGAPMLLNYVTNTGRGVYVDDVTFQKVVVSASIQDGAITTPKMTANSINGDRISAGTLDASKIVADSITAGQIAAGAIATSELAAGAVTAAKIAAGTITANEINAGSITADRITANALTLSQVNHVRGKYHKGSASAVANITSLVKIPIDTADIDPFSMLNVGSGSFTIPGGMATAFYFVRAYVQWDNNTTGRRWIGLLKNGGAGILDETGTSGTPISWTRNGVANIGLEQVTSGIFSLAAGDSIAICGYQDSGASRNVNLAYLEVIGWV